MYSRILVAVDGSTASQRGFDEALRFAKSTGGQLRVVHVINEIVAPLSPDMPNSPAYYDMVIGAIRDHGKKLLQQASERAAQAGVACEPKLIESLGSRAADQIVQAAKEWPADVIVLGTHGRHGLRRLAMGSDAELVVRQSTVPALLIREQPEA